MLIWSNKCPLHPILITSNSRLLLQSFLHHILLILNIAFFASYLRSLLISYLMKGLDMLPCHEPHACRQSSAPQNYRNSDYATAEAIFVCSSLGRWRRRQSYPDHTGIVRSLPIMKSTFMKITITPRTEHSWPPLSSLWGRRLSLLFLWSIATRISLGRWRFAHFPSLAANCEFLLC